jgi:hypothetical protein
MLGKVDIVLVEFLGSLDINLERTSLIQAYKYILLYRNNSIGRENITSNVSLPPAGAGLAYIIKITPGDSRRWEGEKPGGGRGDGRGGEMEWGGGELLYRGNTGRETRQL